MIFLFCTNLNEFYFDLVLFLLQFLKNSLKFYVLYAVRFALKCFPLNIFYDLNEKVYLLTS
jgi:hypothetical protein